jgi:predicted PhzF superfamily epimerase YddE/YHI9
MARDYAFVQVDVFTEQVLRGNPLAVVLDGQGLADTEMQAIVELDGDPAHPRFVWMRHPDATFRLRWTAPGWEVAATLRTPPGSPRTGTGSAGGPLGAYPLAHGLLAPGELVELASEQGTKRGRPSFVPIRLRATGAGARDIRVGGSVVPVLEGRLRVP